MNLYFRFMWLMLTRLVIRVPIDIFSKCSTTFRVNIFDLDLNMHMNNGRYFAIMDLGRFDLLLKSNTFWMLAKQGFFPVVTSQSIRFKKSLGPFQKFQILTQIESWDEKDFYISQKFIKDDIVYAQGYVKGRFLQRGKGAASTRDLFNLIGADYKSVQDSELASAQKHIESLLVQDND